MRTIRRWGARVGRRRGVDRRRLLCRVGATAVAAVGVGGADRVADGEVPADVDGGEVDELRVYVGHLSLRVPLPLLLVVCAEFEHTHNTWTAMDEK